MERGTGWVVEITAISPAYVELSRKKKEREKERENLQIQTKENLYLK